MHASAQSSPLLLVAAALICISQPAVAAHRTFFEGAAGVIPSNPKDQTRTYFDMPQVRAIVERAETRPLSAQDVAAGLAGAQADIRDLLRTKVLRKTPAGYVIGFNYFTLADMKKIHATAQQYVPSLVAAYRAHGREFERIFSRYSVKSVPRERLATVILAGFALNWDGLDMTKRLGYRRPQLVTGPGWKYSFFVSEDDPSYSEHGFIWGSSSLFGLHDNLPGKPVDFEFSSFGDPYSDPRMNLPDVFLMPEGDMTPDVAAAAAQIGLRDETYDGEDFKNVIGAARARSIGPMLFALRERPLSLAQLSTNVQAEDRPHAAAFVKLLVAMEYVRKRGDGRYELITPVFDRADAPMLDSALALHRKILGEWLRRVYPLARAPLASITAVREGVPFESAFTQIWHEYFGLATREMIAAGLIEDPYSKARKHPGSVAALWRRSIYHFDPG